MDIPFEALKANTLSNVELVLKKLPGEKHMLIEPALLRPMDRIVSMRFLSSLGVKKVFKIQQLPPEASFSRLVYFITPNKMSVKIIIDHAEMDQKAHIRRNKLVVFVPKQTMAVKTLLESRGVLGDDLQIADLSFGWIPIDVDLISLNLPEVYTNYFLYGDTAWPYHFGQMLGHVLEAVVPVGQTSTDINLHAFGSAAQVSAAGLSAAIGENRVRKSTTPEANSDLDPQTLPSSTPPLFILFSRNLDYITPFMVPTTFEALIHEVIGIDNGTSLTLQNNLLNIGIVELPNVQKEDMVPNKLNLCSSNITSFKDVRNAHISTVHKWLQGQRSQLEDSRTGLGFSLAVLDRDMPISGGGSRGPSVASLADLSSQLKPILAVRKELTALFICLEEVMRKMANEERVEDLLAAQTAILKSGSGDALAVPVATLPPSPLTLTSSQQAVLDSMPPEAATGTCADDPACQPVRLALEWLSTKFGDRLTEAVRLLCLLSITHDGLGDELYNQVIRHIQHAVGFSIYPMLVALRRLRLLYPRCPRDALLPAQTHTVNEDSEAVVPPRSSLRLTSARAEKLAIATERLIKRRKSTYNRLHRQLRLSMRSQVNLSVDKPAVSPSYVFGGQHVPVVVRLVESLWAEGLTTVSAATGRSLLSGPELLSRDQLFSALLLLHTDERSAKNLGRVSLKPTPLVPRAETGAEADAEDGGWKTQSHGQTVVVAFVGGCTYAEVAALRFAAARRCWRLLIATSQILSTKSLIHQVGQAAAM